MTPDRTQFVRSHTQITSPSLVPEVRLHLATEVTPLWTATQDFLDSHMLPPPYWAFAWPGGQALARYLLDNPQIVRGRHVLSFAAGCGIDAIAAGLAGARVVEANEIDDFACAALLLNAALNDVALDVLSEDVIGQMEDRWEVVIAGDVCYEKPMAERATAWLTDLVTRGVTVITADPGRSYLPSVGLEKVGEYDVPTSLDLEDRTLRTTAVYRWT